MYVVHNRLSGSNLRPRYCQVFYMLKILDDKDISIYVDNVGTEMRVSLNKKKG